MLPFSFVMSRASKMIVPVVVSTTIAARRVKAHGGGRRRSYSRHLELSARRTSEFDLNRWIEVERSFYDSARVGARLDVTLRRGSLGVPWIESLRLE